MLNSKNKEKMKKLFTLFSYGSQNYLVFQPHGVTVKNSMVNAVFRIWPMAELNVSQILNSVPKCKIDSEIKI